MKYIFDIEYIHNSFIEAHPAMHHSHPDFVKAMSTSVYELGHAEDVPMEQAQQSLVLSIEADGCTVLGINGARIE